MLKEDIPGKGVQKICIKICTQTSKREIKNTLLEYCFPEFQAIFIGHKQWNNVFQL